MGLVGTARPRVRPQSTKLIVRIKDAENSEIRGCVTAIHRNTAAPGIHWQWFPGLDRALEGEPPGPAQ